MSHYDQPYEDNPSVQTDWAMRNAATYQARQMYEIRRQLERIAEALQKPAGTIDGGKF